MEVLGTDLASRTLIVRIRDDHYEALGKLAQAYCPCELGELPYWGVLFHAIHWLLNDEERLATVLRELKDAMDRGNEPTTDN